MDESDISSPGGPVQQITLLTKENCPLCDHAKEVLGRVGADYVFDLRVAWLETSEGESLAERHSTPFPPVLLIGDEVHGYGRLSEKRLRRDLDRRRVATTRAWVRAANRVRTVARRWPDEEA